MVIADLSQEIGGLHLQGGITKFDRKLKGLPTHRKSAVEVSRLPAYMAHPGQHPSQPSPIVERPGQDLGLAQQGEAPPILSQLGSTLPTRGGSR